MPTEWGAGDLGDAHVGDAQLGGAEKVLTRSRAPSAAVLGIVGGIRGRWPRSTADRGLRHSVAVRLSVGRQGIGRLCVEQVDAVLVELDMDGLIGANRDVCATLMLTTAPSMNTCTNVMSPVGSTV